MTKRIAAFFDFDNTLIRGDSQDLELRDFERSGKVSRAFLLSAFASYFLYRIGLLPSESMIRKCMASYRGMRMNDLEKAAEVLYAHVLRPRLEPRLLERIEHHRSCTHVLVILSASVEHLIRPATTDLKVEHLICTKAETLPDGALSGKPDGNICIGETKRALAEQFSRENGVDLKESYAYSDHHADIPFLSAVGHPVAVKPTRTLRKYAVHHGWPIIDVIRD